MKNHLYAVTLEHLADPDGKPVDRPAIRFQARNHDDLYAILDRARGKLALSEDETTAMVVGLKLLGEIALTHRDDPLFSELTGHLGGFIKKLKGGLKD